MFSQQTSLRIEKLKKKKKKKEPVNWKWFSGWIEKNVKEKGNC